VSIINSLWGTGKYGFDRVLSDPRRRLRPRSSSDPHWSETLAVDAGYSGCQAARITFLVTDFPELNSTIRKIRIDGDNYGFQEKKQEKFA
jgi:hypothetical protein